MKFLIFSPHGDAAGLAYRIQQEGNDVTLYIPEEQAKPTLEGIIPQVNSVQAGLAKNPDVVLFDMVGYGDIAVRMKKLGYKVIGSGSMLKGDHVQDKMELDRAYGEKVMRTGNILTPETIEYSSAKDAIKFVKERKKTYVIKPNGNKNPFTTYVPTDNEDTIEHLKNLETKGSFILQEKIEGIEISTEMWFSKGKPIYPANGTMETKKFLVGDLGPNTGCQTSLVWFYEKKEPKIVQTTLKKLYTFMDLVQYTGPIDINCIVSSKDHKPYGIEWTARPGYSAIYAMIRLLDLKKMDLSEHLYGIATGEIKEWSIKPGFGYSMRVSIPPYPLAIQNDKLRNDLFKHTEGLKISNYDDSFVPLDVRKKDDGFESAGIDGVIGEITGYGLTIEEAKNDAHSRFKRLNVPQKQARLDGWKKPIKDLETLKAWGFEMPEVNKGDNHE